MLVVNFYMGYCEKMTGLRVLCSCLDLNGLMGLRVLAVRAPFCYCLFKIML